MLGNMYVDKNGRKISDGDKVKINEGCYRIGFDWEAGQLVVLDYPWAPAKCPLRILRQDAIEVINDM